MAQAIKIHEEDMHEFLSGQGFSRIHVGDSTVELVYGKRVIQDNLQLTLRVYTSINPSGESRNVGEDAIRVGLFMRLGRDKIVKLGGSKRVHRVVGWRKNLQERLDSWLEYFPRERCDRCGLPMVPRKGRYGRFIGCAGYPACTNRHKIIEDNDQDDAE